jgi:hypothetical protein
MEMACVQGETPQGEVRGLSQSCFFESLAICKPLNFSCPIFGFYPQNRTLRPNRASLRRKDLAQYPVPPASARQSPHRAG